MKYRRIAIALLLLAANTSSAYAWTSISDEFDPPADLHLIMKPPDNSLGWMPDDIEKQNAKFAKMADAISGDPKNANLYLERANFNFELKKLDAAKSDYDRAIDLDPRLASAYYHRGKLCEYLALQRSVEYEMDFSPKALNMQGVRLDEDNDWPAAIKVLRLAVIREPDNVVYRRNLCRVHDRYGDYFLNLKERDKAAAQYSLALDIDKNHQQAKYRLKHLELPKNLEPMHVENYPLDSEHLTDYKTQVTHVNALYSAALKDYEKAAELAPKNSKPFFRRAKVAEKSRSIDIANEYSHAIDLDRENQIYYIGRARVLNAKGNLDGAYNDYSSAIKIIAKLPKPPKLAKNDPPDPQANSITADVGKRDDFSDGADESKNALPELTAEELKKIEENTEMELNEIRESDAFYERGLVLMKQQKWKEAKDDFTHAIEARVDNDDAFEKRSEIYSRLGNQTDADSDKQAALRIRAGDKFSGSTWNPIEKF